MKKILFKILVKFCSWMYRHKMISNFLILSEPFDMKEVKIRGTTTWIKVYKHK